MEKNTLIKVKKLGKRSKKIFELTNKGRETLNNIHKNKGITKEKILAFRNIISEIFGEHISSYGEYILDIKELSFSIDASKKDQVIKILKKCKLELKKIK